MWEKLVYPRESLPQIYDITYFDAQGEEIEKGGRQYHPLSRDVEREVQFQELAERKGASTYRVHLMTHQEVWKTIREEEGSLLDQYIGFVAKVTRLDKAVETLPVVMHQRRMISLEL